jgi:ATP-dependent RNA helicase DeaD
METATPTRSFSSLELSPETLRSLEAKGYAAPTEVQADAIPRALAGRDLVVQSRTGTGKTAAFGIPIVERIDPALVEAQALVLAPTRELALQVSEELASLGVGKGIRVETIYGGDSIDRQLEAIRAGVHVIVGTPGRVLDHLRRGSLSFANVRLLVLDEADRMLDMGFAVEMGQIMEYVPGERQTLLFSATVPLGIRGLIYHYLSEPEWVLLSEDQVYVKEVQHLYCLTPRLHKEATLYKLLEYENPASSMVFCNTREETRLVYTFLANRGLPAAMLSSDLAQRRRERVLKGFRSGEVRHLVTTDVASRGIDIEDLSHVFIFSTPDSPEQYIHRAGRTGRVGKSGRAISLVSAHDLVNFNRLVKRYHIEVTELAVPSDEEVTRRQVERIVARLAAEGQSLPLDEFAELAPVARRVAEHEHRDRIVALLLRRFLEPPPVEPEDAEADAPLPYPTSDRPAEDGRQGSGAGRRRHGRGRRGGRSGRP